MMLTKKQIIEAIDEMPEEFFKDIRIVLNELVLLEKIEKGLDDIRKGSVISAEDVNREINSW